MTQAGLPPTQGAVGVTCITLSQLRTQTHGLGCQEQHFELSSIACVDRAKLSIRPQGRARPAHSTALTGVKTCQKVDLNGGVGRLVFTEPVA